MIATYWTRYIAVYPDTLLYMLQNTDFRLKDYFAWYFRTSDFRFVMKRRSLERTSKIKLLRIGIWGLWALSLIVVAYFEYLGISQSQIHLSVTGIIILALLPFILAFGITIPLALGRVLIQSPREKKLIEHARTVFANHTATKIAVVGSFGKTTAKEILVTILRESLNAKATPGNMNTPIGISRFANTLSGDEDVLIFELGEEKVGDVASLSDLTKPTMGIITGINESHLISFKSLERTVGTIFELTDYLGADAVVYKNEENDLVASKIDKSDPYAYSRKGVNGWHISELTTSLEGTNFVATKGSKKVVANTMLIGLHTVGVTAAGIAIADSLGMTVRQIEAGLQKIVPFEHRMQPRKLHGAWIIDDTYNGNSDGVTAGLALLKTSKAIRRVYVTPGLVEQGDKTEQVHEEIGRQIAESADHVVLMKNSVTEYILMGINNAKFKGEITLVDNPLEFYTNLEHFVRAGDVVLMQNDWPDNYV